MARLMTAILTAQNDGAKQSLFLRSILLDFFKQYYAALDWKPARHYTSKYTLILHQPG
jgi:hypothetical protein